ncbi:hypothetical protein [Myroides pelagicus]|uniref:Uncharacterized protein n=1 Tax=Myroides pelagicus TaxID=270914 RepID=A0A7K1GIL0_9FLAO|nr:hypothetical protein [Myroides pelagicus]MTH28745.1 hypothetical protein [Myroides pelagicus]
MKMKYLKNLLYVSSISVVIGLGAYGYACADDYWSYASTSSFTPEAFVDKSYKPMFFAPYERFYNNSYISNNDMFDQTVIEEWKVYLGNSVSEQALNYYLLNKVDQHVNASYTTTNVVEDRSADFPLKLNNPKVKKFVQFLDLAKKIEPYTTSSFNYWSYEDHISSLVPDSLVQLAENEYLKTTSKDKFFYSRMWFQVLKAKFYSNNRHSVISYFEETSSKLERNILYYRGLSYVAGAYYQRGNYIMANALYAEAYDKAPQLRQVSTYNFRPMDEENIEKVLSVTSDVGVKCAVWAMNGFYLDEFKSMKAIYALDPGSPHLDYLLTRWVNKLEQKLNIPSESRFSSKEAYYEEIKTNIDQEVYAWIKSVSSDNKRLHNPVMWKLAVAYIDIFQGDYGQASIYLEEANGLATASNKLLKDQIRLFEIINKVSQVKDVNAKIEAELLADLTWLFAKSNKHSYDDPFRFDYASNWVKRFISTIYLENYNPIMAEIVQSEGPSFYSDLKLSNQMEAYLKKTDRSAFEQLFVNDYKYNLSDIYESRSIYLFYQDDLDAAIEEMKKAVPVKGSTYEGNGSYQSSILLGNPFNGKIKDCNDCDHTAKQSVKYTKLSFLEKMKEMKDKVERGEDIYNNALLIGNAFYNTTHFGNARVFYTNSILNEYGGNSILSVNKPLLLSMKLAKKYYDIANSAATTDEQKAKLAYFSAKLERNEFYVEKYHNSDYYMGAWYNDVMFKKWKGFKVLKEKYNNTKFYKEVINECEYFERYARMY